MRPSEPVGDFLGVSGGPGCTMLVVDDPRRARKNRPPQGIVAQYVRHHYHARGQFPQDPPDLPAMEESWNAKPMPSPQITNRAHPPFDGSGEVAVTGPMQQENVMLECPTGRVCHVGGENNFHAADPIEGDGMQDPNPNLFLAHGS